MNINEIKKVGASIGAEFEAGIMVSAGDGLVAKLLPVMRDLPKGKALTMMSSFWAQFVKNAPIGSKIPRVKVTRSESLRLASGVDAGQDVSTGAWNALVKAAPKKVGGKGAGGGRPPRAPVAPTEDAPVVVPKVGKGRTPLYATLQQGAVLLAMVHQYRDSLPQDMFDITQKMAVVFDSHKDDDAIE
jgi:hypothetical protein